MESFPQRTSSGIHLIRRNSQIIIFDEITTQWVCCDEEAFDALSKCNGKSTVSEITNENSKTLEVLSSFEDKGLIFESGKEIIRKPPNWPTQLRISFATLMVSRDCNLDCQYCFAGGGQRGEVMSEETAKTIIDRLFELPVKLVKIHWAGGEPLLGFKTIVEGTKYAYKKAREMRRKLRFSLQTNGTLLTRKKMKILNELKIPVAVSIDGPPEFTDERRHFPNGKGASLAILKGIKTALSLRNSIGSIVTIGSHNVGRIEDVVDFIISIGIRSFKMNPCKPIGRAQSGKEMCPTPLAYFEAIAKATGEAQERDFELTTLRKYVSNLICADRKSELCLSTPNCGAGLRMLCFNYDGDIYPCDEFLGLNEFNCGNITEGALQEIFESSPPIQRLKRRSIYTIEKCQKCPWRHVCGGGCAASAYWEYRSLDREGPFCEARKKLFEFLIWKIVDDADFASKYSNI